MTVAKAKRKASKRYQAFLNDGMRADDAMQRTGLGYQAEDVHRYLRAKVRGQKARRPKPVRWRG
jgi:hypothetical protein